jgi:hypothetical protein
VLGNSLGRYEQALAAAQRANADSPAIWFTDWALVELVEAGARSAVPGRAADALHLLSEIACACGTDWALGAEARSRALVSDGEAAEGLYREAVDRLGRTRLRVDLARARLVYGKWLRRRGAAGASNPDIAAQLFISPATVAYHLREVFAKLDISSRTQLDRALPARHDTAPPVTPQR